MKIHVSAFTALLLIVLTCSLLWNNSDSDGNESGVLIVGAETDQSYQNHVAVYHADTQYMVENGIIDAKIVDSARTLFPSIAFVKTICGVDSCDMYLSSSPGLLDIDNEWQDSPDDSWLLEVATANGLVPIGPPRVTALKDGNAVYRLRYKKP